MTQAKFKFVSDAAGGDEFTVVKFTGRERVSELYRYDIEVKAPLSAGIDLDDVLDSVARFITEQNGVEFPVNGILSSFEEFKTVQNYAHFKAVLVPKIWKLTNYKTNEIFYEAGVEGELDAGQTIAEIIAQVLDKAGMLETTDYKLNGISDDNKLLKREYVCQYNESDFDFISRLMENEGVFYYFEQSSSGEAIVFLNDQDYDDLPQPKLIFDVAAMSQTQDDCVFGWSCRKQRLPQRVVVRDYNAEEPSLDVSDTTTIDDKGQGTEYIYGKNVKTDTEASYLSQLRAEEHICRKTEFFGESSVTRLQAGHCFGLDQHPNTKYNKTEYLAIEVNHEGHGLDMSKSSDGQKASRPQYQNSFVAILATTQYRPPLKTKKPRITGTLHARIDGELDSEYAQLDSEGRYKVSLPFDFHNENHPEGLASARVRMMQPYAGENRGMQFPMAKGTEVLLSFVDGDPDRPIIAGAINTSAAPGPVTASNQTESVIQTGGANKIRMEDKFGSERVMLESPAANSWIRVGATNDPITLLGESPLYVNIGTSFTDPGAIATNSADSANPIVSASFVAKETKTAVGVLLTTAIDTAIAGEYILTYENTTNRNGSAKDTATRRVIVLDTSNDLVGTTNDGIRIRSAGNLWHEAKSKYGDYYLAPSAAEGTSLPTGGGNSSGDLWRHFGGTTPKYAPTGMKSYASQVQTSFKTNVLPSAHLRVSSLDTITTQEGNIYDFGGYWNYNLGNSFAEEHINQKPELNKTNTFYWPAPDTKTDFNASTDNAAASGAVSGAAAGGIIGAVAAGPAALTFGAYAGSNIGIAVGVHAWSAGGVLAGVMAGIASGVLAAAAGATAVLAGGAAVGGAIGAAAGAGLGAIAPDGDMFQGNVGDVMGGPNSGPIVTWAARVGSSFEGADKDTGAPPDDKTQHADPAKDTGPMHPDTTWTTKQFGDAYTFVRGNDIDVRVGNTEEHHQGNSYEFLYGGTHEETKFNGAGRKLHWEKGGGGEKQEAHWHIVSGLLTAYEFKKDNWFSYEGNFVTVPTVSLSTSMSSVRAVVDASVGALDINISAAAGIKMNIGLTAGLEVNMSGKLGGEAEVNFVTMEASFKSFGIKAQKKAAIEADTNDMVLKAVKLNLQKGGLDLTSDGLTVKEKKLAVNAGMQLDGL